MEENALADLMYPQMERMELELYTKQMQLNFLMRITKAINANVSADELFEMYSHFLHKELGVNRLTLFFKEKGIWICKKAINFDIQQSEKLLAQVVGKFKDFSKVGELSDPELKKFKHIIPVLHKDDPIAYSLIGEVDHTQDEYDRIKFMITITNVVAVAIENKRLFKQQIEQEKYKKELELAQQVQKMLIPSTYPNEPGFELSAIYRPHSNIGGDYWDYCKLDDGGWIVCLADVAGKGVPAALLMANFQATLRSALMTHPKLDDLVCYINKTLVAITKSERIVTFFILRYYPDERKIRYVNAGHNLPLLIHNQTCQFLDEGCTVLGAVEDIPEISVGEIQLESSEALIMIYTDGLTDLKNGAGKYFDENIIEEFAISHKDESATMFNEKLLKAMEAFKGKQAFPDDIAVLTCKISRVDA